VKLFKFQQCRHIYAFSSCQQLPLLIDSFQPLKMAYTNQESLQDNALTALQLYTPAHHDHRPIAHTSTFPTYQNSTSTSSRTQKNNAPPQTAALGDLKIPPLRHITLPDIVYAYEHNIFTSVDLVDTCLARIREVDHEFRSVVQVSPTASAFAQALDAERIAKRRRGPLHGIPVLLKDNIPTLDDGTETTCGSMALGMLTVWRYLE
jgi:hypothetical protein